MSENQAGLQEPLSTPLLSKLRELVGRMEKGWGKVAEVRAERQKALRADWAGATKQKSGQAKLDDYENLLIAYLREYEMTYDKLVSLGAEVAAIEASRGGGAK